MTIDLIFPVLPPALDGIGDYTALLARALAPRADVRVLTGPGPHDAIDGVDVEPAFTVTPPQGVRRLLGAVERRRPDWVVLQFNQFSYGRWGLNPFLPLVMRQIKRRLPGTGIAWMAHEDFVPVTSWKFAIMTLWQRWQFWMLGRTADRVFLSIEPWAEKYQRWFPDTLVRHLPVASNIPRGEHARADARRHLGLAPETFVAGVFGTVNASRMLPLIRRAATAMQAACAQSPEGRDFALLYVGPHGADMRAAMGPGLPLLDAGRLPADEVSAAFAAMNLHLTPFVDGVSTRRGSFLAGLQHGVPTVGTAGELTDAMLLDADGDAFLLAPASDPAAFEHHALALLDSDDQRARMAVAARALYDSTFSFEVIAERLLAGLGAPLSQPAAAPSI